MKSCIILCGGRSRRMGQDKGLMNLNGKPLIVHILETLKDLVDEVILVLRDEPQLDLYKKCIETHKITLEDKKILEEKNIILEERKNLPEGKENLLEKENHIYLITDLEIDQGPLIGILTGLCKIKSKGALILPCDSPFITPSFVSEIFKINDMNEENLKNYLAIVPKGPDGSIEPLHAYYSKECIPCIDKTFKNGFKDVKSLFKIIKVNYVDINVLDPGKRSFKNLNRPEDIP